LRTIIDRYILREIALSFFLIVFVLTFVLLMGRIIQLMDLMVNKGVEPLAIGRLVVFIIPAFLVFTIPIALLVAILIALGRLSADNEWIALRSAGISLYQITPPVVLAAVVSFLLTAAMSLLLVPYSNHAMKELLFAIAKQKASIGIRERVFNDDFAGLVLYADRIPVDGNSMEGVIVSDQRTVKEPNIIVARRGYLVYNPRSLTVTLRLQDGSIHAAGSDHKSYRKLDFHTYDLNLDLEEAVKGEGKERKKETKEMTVGELAAHLHTPTKDEHTARSLTIELNRRITIPLACLVFAVLGLPLGITARRAVKARGFTMGLIVVLLYYLVQLSGAALAETGRISPFLGTWAPNGIFAVAGSILFVQAAREVRFPNLSLLHSRHKGGRSLR